MTCRTAVDPSPPSTRHHGVVVAVLARSIAGAAQVAAAEALEDVDAATTPQIILEDVSMAAVKFASRKGITPSSAGIDLMQIMFPTRGT